MPDITVSEITVGGARVSYNLSGRGVECVVLLHGSAGSMAHWNEVRQRLEKSYQVIVPDLYGYGRSEAQHGRAGSLSEEATLVSALIDRCPLLRCEPLLVGRGNVGASAAGRRGDHDGRERDRGPRASSAGGSGCGLVGPRSHGIVSADPHGAAGEARPLLASLLERRRIARGRGPRKANRRRSMGGSARRTGDQEQGPHAASRASRSSTPT